MEEIKANLFSTNSMRAVVDDFLVNWAKTKPLAEVHSRNNLRILVQLVYSILAMIAFFCEIPKDKIIIIACFSVYMILSTLLMLKERDNENQLIFQGKLKNKADFSISSAIEMYTRDYKIVMRLKEPQGKPLKDENTLELSKIFTSDGTLSQEDLSEFLDESFKNITAMKKE